MSQEASIAAEDLAHSVFAVQKSLSTALKVFQQRTVRQQRSVAARNQATIVWKLYMRDPNDHRRRK